MSEIPTDEYPELVEIMKGAWHFLLYESGTRYFLSVLCGSSAAFNLDIELTSEEIDAYQQHGKEFIEWLAKIIFDSPDDYRERHIASMSRWPRLEVPASPPEAETPKRISFTNSMPSQNPFLRVYSVFFLDDQGRFCAEPAAGEAPITLARSRVDDFKKCWDLICAAGFPETGIERTICRPGEGSLGIAVYWRERKTELNFPLGEKWSSDWDTVFDFWKNLQP